MACNTPSISSCAMLVIPQSFFGSTMAQSYEEYRKNWWELYGLVEQGLNLYAHDLIRDRLAAVKARKRARRRRRRQASPDNDQTPPPQTQPQPKTRSPRSIWVKPYWGDERRYSHGAYANIVAEVRRGDFGEFENYMRMSPTTFEEILEAVAPLIAKRDTNYREAIPPAQRLSLTLRFLASGESYLSLQYAYRVSKSTICGIVKSTCIAINQVFLKKCIPAPKTADAWRKIADDFYERWQYPNTVGALDGKHIRIRKPRKGGSWYINYKGFHSIILLALVDANYKFVWIDVGTEGRAGDAGVYNKSGFKRALDAKAMDIPPPCRLPGDPTGLLVPYHIIADDAFAMNTTLLKPYRYSRERLTYEEEVFNYRLSRARRVVENAFGILAHRFRCLLTTLQQEPDVVKEVVKACCTLHNMCCDKKAATTPIG